MGGQRMAVHEDEGSGHSRALRDQLRQAREGQHLSAREVCARIGARLRDYDPSATDPHINTLYAWERFERHPSISNFAAWARVLGFRLVVELADGSSSRRPVMLRTDEAVQAARLMDQLSFHDRGVVLGVARAMAHANGIMD